MYCTINLHLGVDLLELLHNVKYLVRVTSTRRESHVKIQKKHLPITMKGNLAKLN